MKARNLLLTFGLILIVFNLFAYLSPNKAEHVDNSIYYWIGFNLFAIIGFILLIIAFFKHRAVLRKKRKDMVDSLFK